MASTLAVDSIILPPRSAIVEELAPQPSSYAPARTSLVATLLAAPLAFGAVQEWAWGAMAVMAFLLFLFWSIAGARQGRVRIFWSPLYLPAGLFFLLAMIQFAGHLTMDRIATRESLLKLATDLIFFFLAGQLFSAAPEKTTRVLGPTLVVYAFMLALFAIFQFFSSQGLIYWVVKGPGWTFGPYVNHNHYAGLMEMLIPLTVASVLPALRKNPGALLLGFVALIPIASLLLSGSRGGFISLVVEALLAAGVVFFSGPRDARKVTALAGGAAILAAALLFFWMAPRHIAERLAAMQGGTHHPDVELGNRLIAARDSLGILRDHPWLGAGLGSFETVFPRYQSFPSDFLWDHAHNDYAEAIAETGLAGGALILCALGMFLWLAFKEVVSGRFLVVSSASSTPDSFSRVPNPVSRIPYPETTAYCPLPTAYLLRLAAALGCCGVLVHSFADFNFHIPANAAWFVVCAAVATSAEPDSMSTGGKQQAAGSSQEGMRVGKMSSFKGCGNPLPRPVPPKGQP